MYRPATALVIALLLVPPSVTRAQHLPTFSGAFVAGIPTGDFADHLSSVGFGFGGFLGQKVPNLPLTVGVDGAFLIYGLDLRDRPFELALGEPVDAFTTHGIGMAHFLIRLQDVERPLSPYADLLVGMKYLFTQTSLDGGVWEYHGDPLPDTRPFDDLAFSYGIGGGVRMQWLSAPISKSGPSVRFTLQAGLRYLFGSPATYLRRGGIQADDGELVYEVERSRTDLLVPQLGFSVSLW